METPPEREKPCALVASSQGLPPYRDPVRYLFHVHRTVPSWRLVVREDTGMPAATTSEQWRFTRARTPDDVNTDIKREVDSKGWSLFKVGGDFSDVEADMARHDRTSDSVDEPPAGGR